ncbi:MAG: hypothetical protein HOP23_01800 [Methylococcaceae bacterium]|nr:hypothetical protein [Methylococcaceae bacterium]
MKLKQLSGKIGHYFQQKPFDALLILGFVIALFIMSRLYFSVNTDDAVWEQFKTEHDCKLRMTKFGTQRSSWSCNDGKTYYRWRQQR